MPREQFQAQRAEGVDKKLQPIIETEGSVSYLGVELPKAKNRENAPKKEQYADYINDKFSLELQQKIAISLLQGSAVLVEGGTSIGKTTTVRKMASDLGWEVHYVNLNGATDVEDLMGRYIPNPHRRGDTDPEYSFADGKVTSGLRVEEGKIKVIILDEYNSASPNILIRLHEVLDALNRDGEVVLAEDASEKLRVQKAVTKVVALANPPGKGYLQREPMDPAQLRRWVYIKEASELPDETFAYSTRSLFCLESGETLAPERAFLPSRPEGPLSPKAFAEIPGIEQIIAKYIEFHRGAKELLASRKLAADQPQAFTFDDREEPRRVRDFIRHFYRGDLNAVFKTALRYYYAGKLLDRADKDKLEELIANVEYVPPVNTKRKGAEEEAEETALPIAARAAELEALLSGRKIELPVPEQLKLATEILGKENVFGSAAVEKAFGVQVKEIPTIPFSRAELEQARKLEQMLVLRINKTKDGKPMSMDGISKTLMGRFSRDPDGGVLATPNGWRSFVGDEMFAKEVPRAGWALVSKELIPGSTSKNYLQQTERLVAYLVSEVFKGTTVPKVYQEAIDEFQSQYESLKRVMQSDWQEAAKRLSELKITKLSRQSLVETIYDISLRMDATGQRSLENAYSWTSSRDPDGRLVGVGYFDQGGVFGRGWNPDDANDFVGVLFSRRI